MGDQQKSRSALNVQVSASKAALGERSFSKMRMRRQSFGFGKVPGITAAGPRTSQLGIEFKRPILTFYPTYQLEPTRKVKEAVVRNAIDEILDENFTGHKYNVQDSPALALRLSGDIMRRMKTMDYPRYRFIVVVTIAQRRAQCYNNAITFLWDHERDTYIDVQRETNSASIQIKTMDYLPYGYIVVITIAKRRAQCYGNAIMFLWDHERDTYIDVQRETNSASIQGTAFAIYLD